MKRSRTGCHTCRSRRVKCDEQKPKCRNCVKHGVECRYGIKFQWIMLEAPNHSEEFSSTQKEPSSSISRAFAANRSVKARRGPVSRKRIIGQDILSTGLFKESVLRNLPTIMVQTDFDDDDEVISSLNGPGSLSQFKKFKIVQKANGKRDNTDGHDNFEVPFGMQSPLFRPIVVGDMFSLDLDLQLPDVHQLSENQLSDSNQLVDLAKPIDGSPSMIYSEVSSKSYDSLNMKSALSTQMTEMTDQDFFNHFVNNTADELVPIPYDDNPFLNFLPRMASSSEVVWELLVAYGASHMAMRIHKSEPNAQDNRIVNQYINHCTKRLESLLKQEAESGLALLSASIIALIEVDRGNAAAWRYFMNIALKVIRSRVHSWAWDMSLELNSITFRLIGYMCGVGNLSYPSPEVLHIPYWPEWSGSLDYLTGVDLNLLPLYSEAAELILQVNAGYARNLRNRALIVSKALKIMQRTNDYLLEEYIPDSEITAMCVMFQEALQIHVLRRILQYKCNHPSVQRLVNMSMHLLETWIVPTSTIQRCMTFILATLASESQISEHRASLLIRLKHMGDAGFSYNWKICEDIRKHWDSNTSLIASAETTLIV